MRKIRLINSDGAIYDLTRFESFFHTSKGYGFKDSTEFQKIGDNYYALEQTFEQREISGEIVFSQPNAYAEYRTFSKFIRSTPLTIEYTPDETFLVPARVEELEKGELDDGGNSLSVSVKFITLAPFYKSVQTRSATITTGGKSYDYSYPYAYAATRENTVNIDSDTAEESPCKISIYGACTDPIWKHYVNNELVGTGSYSGTIPEGHRLVIDSTVLPYTIKEVGATGETIADRYQFCDFTTERFFFLQRGSNRISVSHNSTEPLDVIVEGRLEYATV